jgi:O-antigen ligase
MQTSDYFFIPLIPVLVTLCLLLLRKSEKSYWGMLFLLIFCSMEYKFPTAYKDIAYNSYRGPSRGFTVAWCDVISWAFAINLLITRSKRKLIRWWPGGFAFILLFAGYGFFTAFFAWDKLYAAFTVYKLIKHAIYFWIIYNLINSEEDLHWIVTSLGLTLCYLGFLVLYHKYVMHIFVIRAQGPFSHPNTLAMVANLLIPISFSIVLSSKKTWDSLLHTVALYSGVLCIIFTKSRGGLAMMGIAFAAVLANSFFCKISPKKGVVLALFGIGAIITGAIAAPRLIARFENADPSSHEARARFNIAAKHMAKDHFFGVGLNCYPHVLGCSKYYYDVYPEFVDEMVDIGSSTSRLGVCHHVYNLIMAEMGYVGLVLFLMMIGYFFLVSLLPAILPKRPNELPNAVAIGLVAGAMTLHAQGLLEWIWFQGQMMKVYFLLCAIVLACYRLDREPVMESKEGSRKSTGKKRRKLVRRKRIWVEDEDEKEFDETPLVCEDNVIIYSSEKVSDDAPKLPDAGLSG